MALAPRATWTRSASRRTGPRLDDYRRTSSHRLPQRQVDPDPPPNADYGHAAGVRRLATDQRTESGHHPDAPRHPAKDNGSSLAPAGQPGARHAFATQQVAWTQHYARPAQVTSLYGKYDFAHRQLDQTYANQVAQVGEGGTFASRIDRAEQTRARGSAGPARPAPEPPAAGGGRKLTWSRETAPISQQGYRRRGAAEYASPGLPSLGRFPGDEPAASRPARRSTTRRPASAPCSAPRSGTGLSDRQVGDSARLRRRQTALLPVVFCRVPARCRDPAFAPLRGEPAAAGYRAPVPRARQRRPAAHPWAIPGWGPSGSRRW
ncbi:MAG: hypothetical protein WKG07_47320 [Hymenobacter sp.]